MKLRFTKMHGLGNDFMVIDAINQSVHLTQEEIAKLGDRQRGVGFDQLLLLESPVTDGTDFNYRIFNADGMESGQCGNGARCLALFARHYGLTNKHDLTVTTKTTQMNLHVLSDNQVSVDMGVPKFHPSQIPLQAEKQADFYSLQLPEGEIHVHALSVGNPHAVLLVSDIDNAPVAELGRQISHHSLFPEQSNAGLMQIIDSRHLRLRVYERGCGETLACGSGAVAAAVVARRFYQMNEEITVSLRGGDLLISWAHPDSSVVMTGPACFVYEGSLL